jgi:hypothetical protein
MIAAKPAIIALGLALIAAPALAADVAGLWRVDGDVDHKTFTLYCTLRQAGQTVAGVCHDDTPTGKPHPLITGSLKGDRLDFTYRSNFLVTHFDAIFSGTVTGDHVQGQASAAGRKGTFVARRN